MRNLIRTAKKGEISANKKRQKDIDARWTKKGGEKHFGYKNHTKVDKGSKFIKKGVTTDASVHDSKPVKELVDENDMGEDLLADSAFTECPAAWSVLRGTQPTTP